MSTQSAQQVGPVRFFYLAERVFLRKPANYLNANGWAGVKISPTLRVAVIARRLVEEDGQKFVEFAWSINNPADIYSKKRGRQIAEARLQTDSAIMLRLLDKKPVETILDYLTTTTDTWDTTGEMVISKTLQRLAKLNKRPRDINREPTPLFIVA